MVQTQIIELISTVNSNFSKMFENDTNIKSIFVVGSMSKEKYDVKKYNDYDLRLLVNDVNLELMNKIDEVINECNIIACTCFPDIAFTHSEIIGPARFRVKSNKTTFLLHCIVLTSDSLYNLPSIHKKSYSSSYYIIIGDDPLISYKYILLKIEDILFSNEGIEYCINCINRRLMTYMVWENGLESFCLNIKYLSLIDMGAYEFMQYSINKAIANINSYINQNNIELKYANQIKARIKSIFSNQCLTGLTYEEFILDVDNYLHETVDILKLFIDALLRE